MLQGVVDCNMVRMVKGVGRHVIVLGGDGEVLNTDFMITEDEFQLLPKAKSEELGVSQLSILRSKYIVKRPAVVYDTEKCKAINYINVYVLKEPIRAVTREYTIDEFEKNRNEILKTKEFTIERDKRNNKVKVTLIYTISNEEEQEQYYEARRMLYKAMQYLKSLKQ